MKKSKLIVLITLILLVLASLYFGVYKGHRDIASEKEIYIMSAISLFDEFKKDEIESNKKYLDNTIEVYGKISSVDLTSHIVVLDNKVIAVFEGKIPQNIKTSSQVKIKGRFIGYDNLLDELKIDQAMIINP